MKKLLIIGLTLTTLASTSFPAFAASNTSLKTKSANVQLQKKSNNTIIKSTSHVSTITNFYDAKVGLTQPLIGNACRYGFVNGKNCADIEVQGNSISVTGTSSGTVVVYAYLNGVLRNINYITFHY